MRFFSVDHRSAGHNLDMGYSHLDAFHGEAKVGKWELSAARQSTDQALIRRSGTFIPDFYRPGFGGFVVTQPLKGKLEGHCGFRDTAYAKLVHLDLAPGDFTFEHEWNSVLQDSRDSIFNHLPDDPALHESAQPSFELVLKHLEDIQERHRASRSPVPRSPGLMETIEVALLPLLLSDAPLSYHRGRLIIRPDVFDIIDPHLDREYFTVIEHSVR